MEPFEDAYVEVPEAHVGQAVDLLGSRKGQMMDMSVTNEGLSLIKYRIPTRCCSARLPACCCQTDRPRHSWSYGRVGCAALNLVPMPY